jgi:hypothetical protein
MTNPLRKPRADSVLHTLPRDQQHRIVDWLSRHTYLEVQNKIAAPAPEGFALKVNYTSLRRFWARHITAGLCSQRVVAGRQLRTLSRRSDTAASPYPALTREVVERYCFHLAINPHANADLFLKFQNILLRSRQLDIQAEKLGLKVDVHSGQVALQAAEQTASDERSQLVDKLFAKLLESKPGGSTNQPETQPDAGVGDLQCANDGSNDAIEHANARLNGQ